MRSALLFVLVSTSAFAQEVSGSLGAAYLKTGSNEVRLYGPLGPAVAVQIAAWPNGPVVPILSLRHARFGHAHPALEAGNLQQTSVTAGLRIQPFRDGRVRPYAHAGLGLSTDGLSADLALGASIGRRAGRFAFAEVASVTAANVKGSTTYTGLLVGIGWRR